jgi:hypothetical protein
VDRLIGTVAVLAALVVVLPALAGATRPLVAPLLSLLVALALLRAVWPGRGRR